MSFFIYLLFYFSILRVMMKNPMDNKIAEINKYKAIIKREFLRFKRVCIIHDNGKKNFLCGRKIVQINLCCFRMTVTKWWLSNAFMSNSYPRISVSSRLIFPFEIIPIRVKFSSFIQNPSCEFLHTSLSAGTYCFVKVNTSDWHVV